MAAVDRHGHARRGDFSPTYHSWAAMKTRVRRHPNYIGVSICDRWLSFELFLADMGERPDGMTLERKSNARGYEPGNCCWATRQEQSANRDYIPRIMLEGELVAVSVACKRLGVSIQSVRSRMYHGRSPTYEHAIAALIGRA